MKDRIIETSEDMFNAFNDEYWEDKDDDETLY